VYIEDTIVVELSYYIKLISNAGRFTYVDQFD